MTIAQPLATKEPYGCGIPLAGASRREFRTQNRWCQQRPLASLFEGGGTAEGRDGRSPPRRSARLDAACSMTELPAAGTIKNAPVNENKKEEPPKRFFF